MFSENIIMAILVVLSITIFTSTTTNALVISNVENITDVDLDVENTHFTVRDDIIVLKSLIGPIEIPIPENSQDKRKQTLERLTVFTNGNINDNFHTNTFADFFECNEQAQIALSAHSENYRYWEAFFKRNSIDDTIAVRYCCNLLEYVHTAQMSLSQECRDQVRLQDHVMTKSEVRHTCRQYEFYNMQCFLVRWMYWWIPFVVFIIIGFSIFCCCCAMKRRSKHIYLKPTEDKSHKSLVTGI